MCDEYENVSTFQLLKVHLIVLSEGSENWCVCVAGQIRELGRDGSEECLPVLYNV